MANGARTEHDSRALFRQSLGNGLAHAAACSRYHCGFAKQQIAHTTTPYTVGEL